MRKTAALNIIVVGAALAGCGKAEHKVVQKEGKEVSAPVLTVASQMIPETFSVSGSVQPEFSAALSTKVMGRVATVSVREGDEIREGQVLATVDGRELRAAAQMADADYSAAIAGAKSAAAAASMEARISPTRVRQAEAAVEQAKAALAAAEAKRDLAKAGLRTQEVEQARIGRIQAESSLKLATTELDRTSQLVAAGAVARKELDVAQNRYDLAKGQFDAAVQAENLAREGTRSQDIRAAEEGVIQARAAVQQAKAVLSSAQAAATQVEMRRRDAALAQARTRQAAAASQAAQVALSYARIAAPFDGRVVGRLADPGTMASPGTPLLQVEGGSFRFVADVPERLIGGLTKGASVPVKLDAVPGKTFQGQVVEIVPKADATSHRYSVKLQIPTTAGIRSGMYGTASLALGKKSQILIPSSATWAKDGLQYVYVADEDSVIHLRIITIGEGSDKSVVVLSGLLPGDTLVTGDLKSIAEGDKVKGR